MKYDIVVIGGGPEIICAQHDFIFIGKERIEPILICLGCKENFTSTLDDTGTHFAIATWTFHCSAP